MKRVALLASLLAGTGAALAQTNQPQFYLWGQPSSGWDNDHQFSPMLRVLVHASPAQTANNLAAHFQNYIDSPAGSIPTTTASSSSTPSVGATRAVRFSIGVIEFSLVQLPLLWYFDGGGPPG